MTEKERLTLEPLPGYPEAIAYDLRRLEDARNRTLTAVQGLTQAQLETPPEGGGNTVGTLLYHLAAAEVDWLYAEILTEDFPGDVVALFPVDVRDDSERLSPVLNVPLETHLSRLSFVRQRFLDRLTGMTLGDSRRPRSLPDYDVTPEWVLHHLAQHEALHRGQILALKRTLKDGPVAP